MHGGLAPSLKWCCHGDRSMGFSVLPVVHWKSPLGYSASIGTESLSWCPQLVTCMWNWSVCTWHWACGHTQCSVLPNEWWSLDWYGHSNVIAWMVGTVWEVEWNYYLLLPCHHQHIVRSELENSRHEGLLSLSFYYYYLSLSRLLCRCPAVWSKHHTMVQ